MVRLKQAEEKDLDICYDIIDSARNFQKEQGFTQWTEDYPSLDIIKDDIQAGKGYVIKVDEEIAGYMCIDFEGEPAYNNIEGAWNAEEAYAVVHRMGFGSSYRNMGLSDLAFHLIEKLCLDKGVEYIRVDTDSQNKRMQHVLAKNGYAWCGTIFFQDGGKLAYDKKLANKTINYYNNNAIDFFQGTIDADMSFCRDKFVSYLTPGARVLDAGCGSGRDTQAFLKLGFKAEAFDASEELCKMAGKLIGKPVSRLRFEELSYENEFDAVWASASLLHVEKGNLPDVLRRLYGALKPRGIIYASFKYGDSEEERDGRFFSSFTENSAIELFEGQNLFTVKECFATGDVRPGREEEKWVNVIAIKN